MLAPFVFAATEPPPGVTIAGSLQPQRDVPARTPAPATAAAAEPTCAWKGLPEEHAPLNCGVLWYMHIAKTGGRDFVTELKGETREVLDGEEGGFTSVRKLKNDWTLAELWYDQNMGKTHPLRRGKYNETVAWQTIERLVAGVNKPRVIVHDHNNMIGFDDDFFFDGILRPMACYLESRGCKMTLATILREPVERAKSHIFFEGNISHDNYRTRMGSIANYQTHYVLHNHNFHKIRDLGKKDLDRAQEMLEHFEVIGQTEEQETFKGLMYKMLGWTPANSSDHDHNLTPQGRKMRLTVAEEEYAKELNTLDAQLYNSFCAADGAPVPRRQVKRLCDASMYARSKAA